VRIAFEAGEGARLPLRIGGKTSPLSGDPLDAVVEVPPARKAWRFFLFPGIRR
jgi:microcystin degradation protein MlrC